MFYLFILLLNVSVYADTHHNNEHFLIRQKPTLSTNHYTLYDPETDTVLAGMNQEEEVPIASLTKLMSMYVVSDTVNRGYIKTDDKIKVSHKAAKIGGSRMFVNEGSLVSINDLMDGAIISSGNDATIALAEHVGGNEESFVGIMNDYASHLNLKHSHFMNSTGLDNPKHYSSSHDIAVLSAHIINDFPNDFYRYKRKYYSFNKIKQNNRNKLLWQNDHIDGLKTGYTSRAKYCLAATSLDDQKSRLIAVVLGSKNEHVRAEDAQALLKYGSRFFKHNTLPSAQTIYQAKVWYGSSKAKLGVLNDVKYNVPIFSNEPIKADYTLSVKKLVAPINKGTVVGRLIIHQGETVLKELPLVVTNDVKSRFWLLNFYDWVSLKFNKLFSKKLI
ncbi:MAG: D-alanyl-D-alanine carboxypeptidase family protein [Pseudomonadota bacterium]|nr:D-alanyl-D-alanine carboxypeptidase family protein [Pseudomonadota bacterium]